MKKTALLITLAAFAVCISNAQPRKILLHDQWVAKRATDVAQDGNHITAKNFTPKGWMNAVVPGTILTTLLHNEQIPDPYFGMNNTLIPDVSKTGRDYYTYWFYKEFETPALREGEEIFLNFRGINYFANVYLNGRKVNTDTHQGMYLREKYRITPLLNKEGKNRLAVWVAPPDPVGIPNDGQGGDGVIARNVTMVYTAGWDWACPIADRNTGIWDEVSLEVTGAADLSASYAETRVPGVRMPGSKQEPAFVTASAEVKNLSSSPLNGEVVFTIDNQQKRVKVTLQPGENRTVQVPELTIKNPKLWWPNGYGDQPLYPAKMEFVTAQGVSDSESFNLGVRELGYNFDNKIKSVVFTCNGQKIFIKGGNWIGIDAMLRLSKERYDHEVRMHRDLHMNMIRVWGGGLTERPDFYEACDKYGLLVWQDLWITGDCNGEWLDPYKADSQERRKEYPDNHSLFVTSTIDQVKMLRNHPSLALWCGGNETYPPASLLHTLEKELFPALDPKRLFLDKSTSPKLMTNPYPGTTGDGPYNILEPEEIFNTVSFPFNPELGSVAIPNLDGLKKFMPEDELVPPTTKMGTKSWLYHKYLPFFDFPDRYGKVKDIEDFTKKAQIVMYEQYRALQEGFSFKMWDRYAGMLVWKNQNPWTGLRGSFYDFYLDYQGSFFGFKHGAAPRHIQLNLNDSVVCVTNQTPLAMENVTATVTLYNLHGKELSRDKQTLSVAAQGMKHLNKVVLPKGENTLFFLRLEITDATGKAIDQNLYWLTSVKKSYEELNKLQPVNLKLSTGSAKENKGVLIVENPTGEVAFFIRLRAVCEKGNTLLPLFLDDNYITLMPGEKREISYDLDVIAKNGGLNNSFFMAEGWNSKAVKCPIK